MSDVFTLNGTALDLVATDALPVRWRERFGDTPELTIQRRGIQPSPEASDTWMGKSLTWTHNGTVYFSGVIRSRSPRRDPAIGWVTDYQAIGIHDLGNKFPVTDKTSGLDVSPFNCQPEDLINFVPARAGRTVGQILTDVLTSNTNAANLTAYNLGQLTLTGGVYSLPSATVTDLAALATIPPRPVYVTGEQFFEAIDGFLQQNAPNVRMWVQPDGTLRFLDLRTFSASTLTMGSDPIEPTEITRDVSSCWQRLEIRGAPLAVLAPFKLSRNNLVEDFAWGANNTNALAKAAWHSTDFKGTTATQDVGTCTCPSTTTVTVTSSNSAETWAADYWDQTATGTKGSINLEWSAGTGITTFWTARIIANTALTAGGTSTITIDAALPHTSFDHYTITGQTTGASQVWRKYKIVDSTIWPLVVAQSTYPQAVVNGGGGATLTSTPMGLVFWPQSGSSPPYNCFPLPFTWDGSTGHVLFQLPTFTVANSAAPADVWVYLPVNTGPNQVFSPQNVGGAPQFTGDSHTIEGLTDTLIGTLADWRDPGQATQVQAYADDWMDAVKDGRREGSIVYHGMYLPALTFGLALNIAGLKDDGTADTTGWESAAIPVHEVEVEFSQGPEDYLTTMHVSNARAHATADLFLHPPRTFTPIGLPDGSDNFSLAGFAGRLPNAGAGLATGDASAGLADFSGQIGSGLGSMAGQGGAGLADFAGQAAGGLAGLNDQVSGGIGLMNSQGRGATMPDTPTPAPSDDQQQEGGNDDE